MDQLPREAPTWCLASAQTLAANLVEHQRREKILPKKAAVAVRQQGTQAQTQAQTQTQSVATEQTRDWELVSRPGGVAGDEDEWVEVETL